MGFGYQSKFRTVTVKAPGSAVLDNLDSRFIMPVEKLIGDLAIRRFVRQFNGSRAVPLDIDDGHKAVFQDALDSRVRTEIFQSVHFWYLEGPPKAVQSMP